MMSGNGHHKRFPDGMIVPTRKIVMSDKIGAGGFGVVYKAFHDDWGVVAFKKLPQCFIEENDRAIRQMIREAEILKDLRHQNVIVLMGVIFEEDNYGIVFEFMKYGNVDQFLSKHKVQLQQKISLVSDIVLGMNYLHTQQNPIIHGDLKIQNVLVTDGGRAKISDFGLSSWKEMSKSTCQSARNHVGTVTHVPPERWFNLNMAPNEEGDVYAFGVLLWEMFTQKKPFACLSNDMICIAVRDGQRPDVGLLPHQTPSAIHSLIETSWAQRPAQRKSFRDIKKELGNLTNEDNVNISKLSIHCPESSDLSSYSSLQCDGLSPASDHQPLENTRPSVVTNPNLPVARNGTGTNSVADFNNIRGGYPQESRFKSPECNANSDLCQPVAAFDERLGNMHRQREDETKTSTPPPSLCIRQGQNQRNCANLISNRLNAGSNNFPVQETMGRSSADVPEDCISLHSCDPQTQSTCIASTQAKVIDCCKCTPLPLNASGGTSFPGPSHRCSRPLVADSVEDLNLKASSLPLSVNSFGTGDNTALSDASERTQQRMLNNSNSVPEADAILSPPVVPNQNMQASYFFSPEQRVESSSLNDDTLIPETRRLERSENDSNFNMNEGFYPKDGGIFKRHTSHNNQLSEPTLPFPSVNVGSTVAGVSEPNYHPSPLTANPIPREPIYTRESYSRKSQSATQMYSEVSPAITIKNDNKETMILDSRCFLGSCIQIGDHNVMHIRGGGRGGGGGSRVDGRGGGRKTDDGKGSQGPKMSHSGISSSGNSRPAAVAAAKQQKQTEKIVVADKLVDADLINIVAGDIGKEWTLLARSLGISDARVDSYNLDFHLYGVREIAYQMLRDWRESKGPQAKILLLAQALVGIKRKDIARKLASKTSSALP